MDPRFYLQALLPRSVNDILDSFSEVDSVPRERPYNGDVNGYDERRLHQIGEESSRYERLETAVSVRYQFSQRLIPPGHPNGVSRQHTHPSSLAHVLSADHARRLSQTSEHVQAYDGNRDSRAAVLQVENSLGQRQYPQSVTESTCVRARSQTVPPYQVLDDRRYLQGNYTHGSRQYHSDQDVTGMNCDHRQRQHHATVSVVERVERMPQSTEQIVCGGKGCGSRTPVDYNHGSRHHYQAVQVDYNHMPRQRPVVTSATGPYYENLVPPPTPTPPVPPIAAASHPCPRSDFSPGQLTGYHCPQSVKDQSCNYNQRISNQSGNDLSVRQRAKVTSATFHDGAVSGVAASGSRPEQSYQQTSTQQVLYPYHPATNAQDRKQNKDSSSLMYTHTYDVQNRQHSNRLLVDIQRNNICDVTSNLPHQMIATAAESIAGPIQECGEANRVADQGGNAQQACAIPPPSTSSCALPLSAPHQHPYGMAAPSSSAPITDATERPSSLIQRDPTSQCHSSAALHAETSCGKIRSSASHLAGTGISLMTNCPPLGALVSRLGHQAPLPYPNQLSPPSPCPLPNSHQTQSVLLSAPTTAVMSVRNTINSESSRAQSQISSDNRPYPGQLSVATTQSKISAWLLSTTPGPNRRAALSRLMNRMFQIVKTFVAIRDADPTNKDIPAYQQKVQETLASGAFAIETVFNERLASAIIHHIFNNIYVGATGGSGLNYPVNNSETLKDCVNVTKNLNDSVSCTLTSGSDMPANDNGSEHQIVWKRQFGTLKKIQSNASTPVHVTIDTEIDDDVIIIENFVDNNSANADDNYDLYHTCILCKRRFAKMEELEKHIDEHLHEEESPECPAAVRIEQRATDTFSETQVEKSSLSNHCVRTEDVQGNGVVSPAAQSPPNSHAVLEVDDPESEAAFDPLIFNAPPGSDTVLTVQHDGADTVISLNDSPKLASAVKHCGSDTVGISLNDQASPDSDGDTSPRVETDETDLDPTPFVDQASLPTRIKIKQALASKTVKVEFDLPNCHGWTVAEKVQVARLISNCLEEVEYQKNTNAEVTQNDLRSRTPGRQLDDCVQENLELQEKATEAARIRKRTNTTDSQSIQTDQHVEQPVKHSKKGQPHFSTPCPVVTLLEKAPRLGISNEPSANFLLKPKAARVTETSHSEPQGHRNLFQRIGSLTGVSSIQHRTAQQDREKKSEAKQKGADKTGPELDYEQAIQNSGNSDHDARSSVDGKTNSSVTSDENAWNTCSMDVQRGAESALQRDVSNCARRNRNSADNKTSKTMDSSSMDPCAVELKMLSNGQTLKTKMILLSTPLEVCTENMRSVPAVGIVPASDCSKAHHMKHDEICVSEIFKKHPQDSKCNKLAMSPRVVLVKLKENFCGQRTKVVKESGSKSRLNNDREPTVRNVDNVMMEDYPKHNKMELGKDETDFQDSSRDERCFEICENCGIIFTDKLEYDTHSCFAESSSEDEDEAVDEANYEVKGDKNDSSLAANLMIFPWMGNGISAEHPRSYDKPLAEDDKRLSSSTKHSKPHNSSLFNASSSENSPQNSLPLESVVSNPKLQTKSSTSTQNKDSVLSKCKEASATMAKKPSSVSYVTYQHKRKHSDSSSTLIHPSDKAIFLTKKYKGLSSSWSASHGKHSSISTKSDALNHPECQRNCHFSSPETSKPASHRIEDRSLETPKKDHHASVKYQSVKGGKTTSSSKQSSHPKDSSSRRQRDSNSSRNEKLSTQGNELKKKVVNNAPSKSNASTKHHSTRDCKKCPKKRSADAMSCSKDRQKPLNLWDDEEDIVLQLPSITSKRNKAQPMTHLSSKMVFWTNI